MHLYMITRGIKPDVDRFINDLLGKYMPYQFHGEAKNVQCGVRPIQLWEVAFPEPQLDNLLRTVHNVQSTDWKINFLMDSLRKLLKADKIPEYNPDPNLPSYPVYKNNVAIYKIGIKKDFYEADGTEQI